MVTEIQNKFERMGARANVTVEPRGAVAIDFRRDARGEYFELRHDPDVAVRVFDDVAFLD